jgi:phenylacetate-CoA ligase
MAAAGTPLTIDPAEALSPAAYGAHADRLLARLCARAWTVVPELTERLRVAGFGPERWPDRETLPRVAILHKLDIPVRQRAEPPLGGLAPSNRPPQALFFSAGGIVEPDMPAAEARLADIMRAAGFGSGDVVLNGFSYHLTPAGWLFHRALVAAGCTVLPGGTHNADVLYDYMVRTRATGFVGISSHLKVILDRAVQDGRDPRRELALSKALAGAEPMAGPIRRELAQQFGVAARDIYGAAEVGIVGFECEHGAGLHLHPTALVELVDPVSGERSQDGEPGHIVLTVDTPEYPMLRFGTGDLGTVSHELCGCGRRSPRVTALLGRVGASARVRGMLVHEAQVREALAAHPAIAGGIVEVGRRDGRDTLTATIAAPAASREAAIAAFAERFAARCRLNLDRVDGTDALPAGPPIRDLRFVSGPGGGGAP